MIWYNQMGGIAVIQSNGKNQYKDNCFSFWEWSAPILQTPDEVIHKVHELKLVGRVVKDIIAVGMGYNWRDDDIADAVYNSIERMHPVLKSAIPNPEAFLPFGVELSCFAELDEPLLIVFEDGDVLAVCFDEGSCVRMELNTVPVMIEPGINFKTFHANRLFKDLMGRRVVAVEVTASTEEPDFTGSHGLCLDEQTSYISKLDFVYDDETINRPRRRLSFEAWYDYGCVSLTDYGGQTLTVPATDVPWIVEGFVDPDVFK